MRHLPSRQVHLDFHTSEYIRGVGSKFDKRQFQNALIEGHVNSVTVFGKCHHGFHYFPTTVGTIHPGLSDGRDFAGEMMDACHEIGVYAPLYLTLGWSALDAKEHPEWIARNKDGSYKGVNYNPYAEAKTPKPECSWLHLCSAGGYRNYLYAMTREACERYDRLDGLFFDIVFVYDACYCDECVRGMRKMGLDPEREEDAAKYYQIQKKETLDGLRRILMETHPEATIFFNSGGAEINLPQWHYASTHFEMEDLPTAWGGYDKMPLRARYFSGLHKDYLGMTGKFHRSWGEFGGYKTPEALKYECAAMLANGARISIGDQLHPLGIMDADTYRNIGEAFSYVEQIEDYCFDVEETAKLGVMVSTDPEMSEAISKLLLDCQVDFDVVHDCQKLKRYDTVLLPDNYRLDDNEGRAFDEYIWHGGKVMMLGGSGLKKDSNEFEFDIPLVYKGKSSYDIDYFELRTQGGRELPDSPVLCYRSAHIVEGEGKIYAGIREPYFNRTYGAYCSHFNTPYREEQADYPGAVKCGNILYVAHELAAMYKESGMTYHRRYFKYLLRKLYQSDCVRIEMPSQGRIHFVRRKTEKQYILHIMYAVPIQRGNTTVLDDIPELYDIKAEVYVPEEIKKIMLIPQNKEIPFEQGRDKCLFTVPKIVGHQMLVLFFD